jgi:hypothetical protein
MHACTPERGEGAGAHLRGLPGLGEVTTTRRVEETTARLPRLRGSLVMWMRAMSSQTTPSDGREPASNEEEKGNVRDVPACVQSLGEKRRRRETP